MKLTCRLLLLIPLVLVGNIGVLAFRTGNPGDQVTNTLSTLLNGYDKRVRPNFGGMPVEVDVTIYFLSIDSVSHTDMEMTATIYLRQKWKDPRLRYTGHPHKIEVSGNDLGDKIWAPDTLIVNEKYSVTYDSFTRIQPEGDVLRSIRKTMTANCAMQLRYFPLDAQLCNLELESFSYPMTDVKYNWGKAQDAPYPIGISNTSVAGWNVVGHFTRKAEILMSTGNYSRLGVDIQFNRQERYYLGTIYLPAVIFVVLSWVAFWIHNEVINSRLLIGVCSVLMLVQLWRQMLGGLPKTRYLKATDLYLVTCIAMVFFSMIESALVGYFVKRKRINKKIIHNGISGGVWRREPCCLNWAACFLDWFSRLAFPLLFVGFNVMYWKVFGKIANEHSNIPNIIKI